MRNIIVLYSLLTLFLFSCSAHSQISCNIPKDDIQQIFSLGLKTELENNDRVVFRYGFNTICLDKVLSEKQIEFWSESKLYAENYADYYTLVEIQYSGSIAHLIFLQRNNNIIIEATFNKKGSSWFLLNLDKKQGRLKGHDFLLDAIKKKN